MPHFSYEILEPRRWIIRYLETAPLCALGTEMGWGAVLEMEGRAPPRDPIQPR
eukprot:COSAG06_NODE_239_length_19404_cov_12.723284_8_plen_53_part_00